MQGIIIARGNGYAGDNSFDGFDILAEPLPTRDSRVFRRESGNGTDYGSHSIKLAARTLESWQKPGTTRSLFILMQHGGGRLVIRIPDFYDGGTLAQTILALPERVQYSMLYTMAGMAQDADYTARGETRREWAAAFCDGRIKKSRPRQGKRHVEIIPPPPCLQTERVI